MAATSFCFVCVLSYGNFTVVWLQKRLNKLDRKSINPFL